MELTKQDKKRIGKVIQAIRQSNKLNTDNFADKLGVSKATLESIENGRYNKKDWEDIISAVARISFYATDEITNGHPEDFRKNCFFDSPLKIDDVFDSEYRNNVDEYFNLVFPLFENKSSTKNVDFDNTLNILKTRATTENVKECIKECIDHFIEIYKKFKIKEACLNALSFIGIYFTVFVDIYIDEKRLEELESTKFNCRVEMMFQAKMNKREQFLCKKQKEKFFSEYDEKINWLMAEANKFAKYKDYAYFFLANRYIYNIFKEGDIDLEPIQIRKAGKSMMNELIKMKNKYAIALDES